METAEPWHATLHAVLKANAVRLFAYVPDRVLTPLIRAIEADPHFTALAATREEEAAGILAGAYMAGMRGVLAMQTSGFATLPNVLASLVVPSQIPLLMLVSERGTPGRVQPRPGPGLPHRPPRAGRPGDRAPHRHPRRRARLRRRPHGPPGVRHPGPRLPGAVAAADRRQGVRLMHPHANRKRMNRHDLTARLVARLHRNEAVVAGIGNTNFDLWMTGTPPGQRPQNFYMLGSMGLAVPIALGVALAQPGRGVVALEGDGSLLMQLGCLATVGARAPANLLVVAMDNGCYQITGGQPTATADTTDLVAVAAGMGIASSHWANDEAGFEDLVGRCLATPGPHFLAAPIDAQPAVGATERDPMLIRHRFMQGIKPQGA